MAEEIRHFRFAWHENIQDMQASGMTHSFIPGVHTVTRIFACHPIPFKWLVKCTTRALVLLADDLEFQLQHIDAGFSAVADPLEIENSIVRIDSVIDWKRYHGEGFNGPILGFYPDKNWVRDLRTQEATHRRACRGPSAVDPSRNSNGNRGRRRGGASHSFQFAGGRNRAGSRFGGSQFGGSQGGGSRAGGSQWAGSQAGGSRAGGSQWGGSQGGGSRAGGSRTGGSQWGGSQGGGSRTGGSQFGGSRAAGSRAGGSQWGGSRTGESRAGGSQWGGSRAGGSQFGGSRTGQSRAGGSRAGGSQWDGSRAGGSRAGGSQFGGSRAEGSRAGGSQGGGRSARVASWAGSVRNAPPPPHSSRGRDMEEDEEDFDSRPFDARTNLADFPVANRGHGEGRRTRGTNAHQQDDFR